MLQRGLEPAYSDAALREAEAIVGPAEDASVRDLTAWDWVSIDNDDSRDLDQLSFAELLPDGDVKLSVAIADVDALVHKGSALDAHAQANTTSVYTASGVFSMLPEKLSTDLSSKMKFET